MCIRRIVHHAARHQSRPVVAHRDDNCRCRTCNKHTTEVTSCTSLTRVVADGPSSVVSCGKCVTLVTTSSARTRRVVRRWPVAPTMSRLHTSGHKREIYSAIGMPRHGAVCLTAAGRNILRQLGNEHVQCAIGYSSHHVRVTRGDASYRNTRVCERKHQ